MGDRTKAMATRRRAGSRRQWRSGARTERAQGHAAFAGVPNARGVGLLLMAGLALAMLPAAHAAPGNRESFEPRERRDLEAGELVVRAQETQRGGHRLIGGSSWQLIDVPPEVVWRALLDTDHYVQMLPSVVEAKLVSRDAHQHAVFLRQGTWPVYASYHLIVRVEAERRQIHFQVDRERPASLDMGWGGFQVYPYGEGRSLLAFSILADVGTGVLAAATRGIIHEWMLKTPWTIKRYLESGGKNYYR